MANHYRFYVCPEGDPFIFPKQDGTGEEEVDVVGPVVEFDYLKPVDEVIQYLEGHKEYSFDVRGHWYAAVVEKEFREEEREIDDIADDFCGNCLGRAPWFKGNHRCETVHGWEFRNQRLDGTGSVVIRVNPEEEQA
jgi:hypothetical protein